MMLKVLFLCLLLCCVTVRAQNCIERSFQKITVRVFSNKTAGAGIHDHEVLGCVTPITLPNFNNENVFLGIKISEQSIPNLRKGIVAGFRGPISITIEDNEIETVKKEAFFNLPGARTISLLSNNLHWLETEAFSNLPSLLYINLEKNLITTLPPHVFNNLKNLERLVLNYNKLKDFKQESLRNTPNLQVLEITHNEIVEIQDETFSDLTSLTNLDLYSNRIKTLHPNAFSGLENLHLLNLGNNMIKDLDFNFAFLSSLALLQLEANYINYIPDKVLQDLHLLKTLAIHSNPLQCSCHDKLINWSREYHVALFTQCTQELPVCIEPIKNPFKCVYRTNDDFPPNLPNFKLFLGQCPK